MWTKRFFARSLCFAGVALLLIAACAAAGDEPSQDLHGDPLPDGAVARLGTVRYRASGQVFLADGRSLLGCDGRHLTWLDVTTGRVTQSLDLETDFATLLAVTPDRSTAAVETYRSGKVEVEEEVEVEDEEQVENEDGEYSILLIDTSTAEERSRLRLPTGHKSQPVCAAFNPDGNRLAMGAGDGILRVWDMATGREQVARPMPAAGMVGRDIHERVQSIAFSPDGKWLVAASSRQTVRWLWQSDARMEPLVKQRQSAVAFAPDSVIVATAGPPLHGVGGPGPSIRLFDVAWGRQVQELFAPKGAAFSLDRIAFTSDGSRLVVPMYSPGGLTVWNVQTGVLERTLPLKSMGLQWAAGQVALSPDDRWVAAPGQGLTGVWDFSTGERVGGERIGHLQMIAALSVSPDGEQVLTAGSEGLAILWETESGRPVHVWRNTANEQASSYGIPFSQAVISPDGMWIAASPQNGDQIILRDRKSMETVYTLPGHRDGGFALQFTPDSARLLSLGEDWFLRAFDLRTGKAMLEHAIRPIGMPLNEQPDGSVTQKVVQHGSLVGLEPSPLKAAEFTRDGKTLVLLSSNKVHLFDTETGQERGHYRIGRTSRRRLRMVMAEDEAKWADQEAASLNSHIAVSPNGRHLATVGIREATRHSRKYVLQIRRLEDGKVTASFPLDDHWSTTSIFAMRGPNMAFSPDGSKIAMASRTINVYDVAAGRLAARIATGANGLTFTPDGERLVAFAGTTGLVWQWKRFLIGEQ